MYPVTQEDSLQQIITSFDYMCNESVSEMQNERKRAILTRKSGYAPQIKLIVFSIAFVWSALFRLYLLFFLVVSCHRI